MAKPMDDNIERIFENFDKKLNSDYTEIEEMDTQTKQKRAEQRESWNLWNKCLENKRLELKELEKKLFKVDLEGNTLLAESEALNRDECELEESIHLLKTEIYALTVEKKRLTQEREVRKETAVKTYRAVVTAMTYYKLHLECYIDMDNSDSSEFSFCFLCDFCDLEKMPLKERNCYITLEQSEGDWKVLEMKPSLLCGNEAMTYLRNSGDIIGFISHVYDVYAELRESRI